MQTDECYGCSLVSESGGLCPDALVRTWICRTMSDTKKDVRLDIGSKTLRNTRDVL